MATPQAFANVQKGKVSQKADTSQINSGSIEEDSKVNDEGGSEFFLDEDNISVEN